MTTILVIEDEQDILDNTVDLLKMEGFHVLPARDGLIGLELAREHLPDIILCDIWMPEVDGFQVLDKLQEDTATASISFIFVSAHANPDDIERARNMGLSYLVKPFSIDDLMNSIRKYVD